MFAPVERIASVKVDGIQPHRRWEIPSVPVTTVLARGGAEIAEPATGPAPASLMFPVGPSWPG